MRLLLNCSVLFALASAALLCHGANAEQHDDADSAITPDREGKFFKIVRRTTTTSFSVVRSTTTVPFTCMNMAPATTACSGRKKRRRRALTQAKEHLTRDVGVPNLQPSIGEAVNSDTVLNKEDRLIITSWSTRFTTFTSVSTVTTFGSTVSLTALCTLGGISQFPVC